jgi:hypothetical protein
VFTSNKRIIIIKYIHNPLLNILAHMFEHFIYLSSLLIFIELVDGGRVVTNSSNPCANVLDI